MRKRQRTRIVSIRLPGFIGLTLLLLSVSTSCDSFYDEGARFANQVADFAEVFRKSASNTAEFDYTLLKIQTVRY